MITEYYESPHLMPRACRVARMSWDTESKSDSEGTVLGPLDRALMIKLAKAGSDHSAAFRQAVVHCRIRATRGWWQHFAKYRMGVEMYSTSLMHRGLSREYTQRDFRFPVPNVIIDELNKHAKDKDLERLTNLMPEGLLQERSVMMSYPAMRSIYAARSKHRKPEWREFLEELLDIVMYPEFIVS